MEFLNNLFENNRQWSEEQRQENPEFFRQLVDLQNPEYLWIGCADSRVPANEITGLRPGEVFVHRNIGNVVVHSDLNCLSVLQYAVEILRVKHVLVVGHYGCGGVKAALNKLDLGLSDNWIRHIRDVKYKHHHQLELIEDYNDRLNRLCELNVIEQTLNVCHTTVIREAWRRGQSVIIHSWVYGLEDGLLDDLSFSVDANTRIMQAYDLAVDPRQSPVLSRSPRSQHQAPQIPAGEGN